MKFSEKWINTKIKLHVIAELLLNVENKNLFL